MSLSYGSPRNLKTLPLGMPTAPGIKSFYVWEFTKHPESPAHQWPNATLWRRFTRRPNQYQYIPTSPQIYNPLQQVQYIKYILNFLLFINAFHLLLRQFGWGVLDYKRKLQNPYIICASLENLMVHTIESESAKHCEKDNARYVFSSV